MSRRRTLQAYDADLYTLRRVRQMIDAHVGIAARAGEQDSVPRLEQLAADLDEWIGNQKTRERKRRKPT